MGLLFIFLTIFLSCQALQCGNVGFVKGECSAKKQKTISCQVCDTSYHKRCTQIWGRNRYQLSVRYQSCFVKNVLPSEVNESPWNDQNQSRNSFTNIIITVNGNKSDLYNSCNSVEVPFDDDNHYIYINSKYFNIN